MSLENTLKAEIEKLIVRSSIRAAELDSGLWVIEAVIPDLSANRDQYVKIIQQQLYAIKNTAVIWKIFLYTKQEDRFLVEATLHTVPRSMDRYGVVTITLAANDCFLLITEFDNEVLQLGKNDYSILSIEARNTAGQIIMPLLPAASSVKYQNIEFSGMMFSVKPDNIKKDTGSGIITIEVGLLY